MQKNYIVIFVGVLLAVLLIFGIAIWSAKSEVEKEGIENKEPSQEQVQTNTITQENQDITNVVEEPKTSVVPVEQTYLGTWYINQLNYDNTNSVKLALERKTAGEITEEEYKAILEANARENCAILNIKGIVENKITLDFILETPLPEQKIDEFKDINVTIENNTGSFTYTDSLGTEGNGTINLLEDKISIKLENTKVAEGADFSVEGIYEFTYKAQ